MECECGVHGEEDRAMMTAHVTWRARNEDGCFKDDTKMNPCCFLSHAHEKNVRVRKCDMCGAIVRRRWSPIAYELLHFALGDLKPRPHGAHTVVVLLTKDCQMEVCFVAILSQTEVTKITAQTCQHSVQGRQAEVKCACRLTLSLS